MKKIDVILVALEDEIEINSEIKSDGLLKYLELDSSTYLFFTGVGKINASMATTHILEKYQVNKILNIGTVGSINPINKIGDIIFVNKIYNGDADARYFGYDIGQTPREKKNYKTTNNLSNTQKNLITRDGNLMTTDSFVSQSNINKFDLINIKHIDIIDMECVGIAQVCEKYNINLTVIKLVSDSVSDKVQDWAATTKILKTKIASFINNR